MSPLDGLLLIDKPAGPTSHDVVQRVRRVLGMRRVGHSGTLDPLATGLLPIVLGRATRLVRFLPDGPKTYLGTLRLGLTTLSDDASTPPLTVFDGGPPEPAAVGDGAASLEGEHMQVPPVISARHVAGQRLYRLNRTEERVRGPARPVFVTRFRTQRTASPDSYAFEAVVSAGTYVRALVRDLGTRLGCGAVLTELRRSAIGPLVVTDAIGLPEVADPDAAAALARHVIGLDRVPLSPPDWLVGGAEEARRFEHGMDGPAPPDCPAGLRRVTARDGRLLGIGAVNQGTLRPVVVLPPAGRSGGA